MKVNNIPVANAPDLSDTFGVTLRIQVDKFYDARNDETVAIIDNRALKASGDIGVIVEQALERQFVASGFKVTLLKSPQIQGEIRRWQAAIQPGFPATKAVAQAALRVTLRDRQGRIMYTAEYSGETNMEDPFMSEGQIESLLGEAMAQVIGEIILDRKLIDKIASVQ